jgi:hypothetical protein
MMKGDGVRDRRKDLGFFKPDTVTIQVFAQTHTK